MGWAREDIKNGVNYILGLEEYGNRRRGNEEKAKHSEATVWAKE